MTERSQNRRVLLIGLEYSGPPLRSVSITTKDCAALRLRQRSLPLRFTNKDKSFVYRLKSALNKRGVNDVWVDEAEIMVGDSLIKKIEEAITKARYFGVVLSPRSVRSRWVKKELEIAMNMEIRSDSVIVLPLLLENCEIRP